MFNLGRPTLLGLWSEVPGDEEESFLSESGTDSTQFFALWKHGIGLGFLEGGDSSNAV